LKLIKKFKRNWLWLILKRSWKLIEFETISWNWDSDSDGIQNQNSNDFLRNKNKNKNYWFL
jgi:hypothetical protein